METWNRSIGHGIEDWATSHVVGGLRRERALRVSQSLDSGGLWERIKRHSYLRGIELCFLQFAKSVQHSSRDCIFHKSGNCPYHPLLYITAQ